MSFSSAVQTCLNKYVTFAGRASRSEFWWFYLFTFILTLIFDILNAATNSGFIAAIGGLVSLLLVLPSLAVGTRRLHDIGRTGWWQLLSLTVIGLFVLLYWFVQPSEPNSNPYGAPPAA